MKESYLSRAASTAAMMDEDGSWVMTTTDAPSSVGYQDREWEREEAKREKERERERCRWQLCIEYFISIAVELRALLTWRHHTSDLRARAASRCLSSLGRDLADFRPFDFVVLHHANFKDFAIRARGLDSTSDRLGNGQGAYPSKQIERKAQEIRRDNDDNQWWQDTRNLRKSASRNRVTMKKPWWCNRDSACHSSGRVARIALNSPSQIMALGRPCLK